MGLTSVKIAPASPFISAPSTNMVEIRRIKIGSRMRPLGDLSALMESIRAVGLLNPITVTAGLRLVAGLHRLEACRRLGYSKIPAIVLHLTDDEAQLIEIDENLIRNDLTVLERAEHYYRRKELYDSLFPDTKHGGRRGNQHTGGIKRQVDNLAFCHETANKTGESSRTIRRLIQIARNLNIGAKKLLRDTEWATNCQKLLKLSKLDARLQKAIAAKVAKGEAINVNEAANKVHVDAWLSKPCALPLEGKRYRLLHGDFRKVGTEIPSSSINLILTDAPYETEFLDVFRPFRSLPIGYWSMVALCLS